MQQLLAGYARFRTQNLGLSPESFEPARAAAPHTLFLCCADSRMVPETLTQCAPGELFCCPMPGNLIAPPGAGAGGLAATIEYAVQSLGVSDAVVCGHTDCCVLRGLLDARLLRELPAVRTWLEQAGPLTHAFRGVMQDPRVWPEEERLRTLTELNVIAQMRSLSAHPSVARAMRRGRLRIHGWLYDRQTGEVDCLDPARGSFRPLLSMAAACAA